MKFPSNILNSELVIQRYHCQSAYPLNIFDIETFLDECLEGNSFNKTFSNHAHEKSEFMKLYLNCV